MKISPSNSNNESRLPNIEIEAYLRFHVEEEEEEEEEETLFDPKCTIHHISDAKLDIKQYTPMFRYIYAHTCTYTCTYTYIINTKTI